MKASKQITETEQMAHQTDVPIDPFAFDFFGVKTISTDEPDLFPDKRFESKRRIRTQKESDWYKSLPRVTNTEAEFSFLLQNLPENLTEDFGKIISQLIARYTFRQTENVKCSVISVDEINLNEAANQTPEAPQLFLSVVCKPENSEAVIAFDTELARSMINSILGGQGTDFANLRNLSPIENTIIEFLAVNILGEINNYLGEPLLCLQNLKNEFPASFEPFEHGAEIVFGLESDNFNGIIKLFATQGFLNNLDDSQNPLLLKKSRRKNLSYFEKITRKLDLRLQVGATFLDADSLLFLEPDDIVLIEQPKINVGSASFGENLQICIGRGRNVRFQGTAHNNELSGELIFKIGEILSEEARRRFTPAKFKMDEKENELQDAEEISNPAAEQLDEESNEEIRDEQISPSLENVQVALRVEIAGNKLSLRELQNLRAGQIIALGCRPTDPVRLVTDHNEEPVATGELVEIEGQLGVRLTKVFI